MIALSRFLLTGIAAAIVASAIIYVPLLVVRMRRSVGHLAQLMSVAPRAPGFWPGFMLKLGVLLGLGVSTYLSVRDLTGASILCPPGATNCDQIWGNAGLGIAGLPLPIWGAAAYVAIAVCLASKPMRIPFSGSCLVSLVTLCLVVSGGLSVLQLLSADPVCIWCLLSGGASGLMAGSLASMPGENGHPSTGAE
jgi:uncharacterized membrane protein